MPSTVASAAVAAHRVIPEIPREAAKADLRKPEVDAFRVAIGRAVDRARLVCGWNLDEFAAAVGRDSRQVRRWIDGSERPQFDALFAVEALRAPLVVQLAGLSGDIEIVTELRVRRTA